jgi:NADH-quinone oxidoreductase subunit N
VNVHDAFFAMLPEHVLLAGLVLLLVVEMAWGHPKAAVALGIASIAGALGAAFWLSATGFSAAPFEGAYAIEPAGSAAKAILLALALPVLLMASGDVGGFRFHALVVSSLYGALILTGATSFLTLFLGIELLSIPVYALVLVAFKRRESAEAALKYLILGGAATAMLLMGAALLFGRTGSLSLDAFCGALGADHPLAKAGVGLVVAALFLKAAIVPFHAWAPDVYEGASLPVTAYMATVVKAAVLFAALRLFGAAKVGGPLADLLALLPLASIAWGNLAAMRQRSFRRMIAYSSIAHAGYLFLALLGDGPARFLAIAFYALAYGLLNLLAFAAVPMTGDDATRDDLDGLRGLFSRRPFAAVMIGLAMLSLAGIPPLPGFAAKFFIFKNVMAAGFTLYAVLGLVGSYLGIYFYLRVIQLMFMSPSPEGAPSQDGKPRPLALAACALCLLGALILTVVPGVALGSLFR